MTEAELQTIRKRCVGLSPAHWYADDDVGVVAQCGDGKNHPDGNSLCEYCVWLFSTVNALRGDVRFVAHARQDIPALLAEVERLQQAVAAEREACAKIAEEWTTPNTIPLDCGPVYVTGFGKPIAVAIRDRGESA